MEQDKIVIEHLNLWYGSFQALKDINLRLPANEITAFIGPSGCGKSTLLKSLNRMNDLVEGCRIEGTVTLDGEDIFSRKMDVNLLRGAAIWDEVKDRLKKSALGMSGGQQQRLCIARALAVEPEVLLMDEPTSALDPISTSRIEELAMELKKDYTIVMVTHNMQQAARISDKTAFFLLGDMVEFGPTEKIFSMHTLKNETDKQSAEKAAALEREIDHKEREIESLCMKLLLQQQPVARDLRTISSALKMISDLERIGDQASDIAGITGYIEDEQLKSGTHIYEMARAASRMVTDSVDSFVRKDLGKARAVQKEDDIVDGLFDTVKNELVGQITEHPDLSGECLDLLMIAKYLERIGDHAVNVAEWVEYSITGAHAGE